MGCSPSNEYYPYDPHNNMNRYPTANPNNRNTNGYPTSTNTTTTNVANSNPTKQLVLPSAPPQPINKPQANQKQQPLELDKALIERFLEIQAQIDTYDKLGVFEALKTIEDEHETLLKKRQQAQVNFKVAQEKTKKEQQDYENITRMASAQTVNGFFKDSTARNKAISKEEQEFLAALNDQEIADNELKTISDQYDKCKVKYDQFKKENEKAIQLNIEQSNILSRLYDGDYGSQLENELEEEVNQLTETKQSHLKALQKWSNAKFLLVHAYNQIQTSEQRWLDLTALDINDHSKVILATEVRNNLVAANQNLSMTKETLKGIDIPYCSDEDLATLKAISQGVFQDMQNKERQQYVLNIIQVLRKRAAALSQWMEQVIKDSIITEYTRIRFELDQKSKQLKLERIKLMQDKIKEKTGKTVNIKIHDLQREMTSIDMNPVPNQPAGNDNKKAGVATVPHEITEKPVSIGDLPPPPSRDQILGNLEHIKKKYWQQVDDWNKNVEDGKREADEKLAKILSQYQPKNENAQK